MTDSSSKCPVDHTARQKWSDFASKAPQASTSTTPANLSKDREISSIPRHTADELSGNWVYPSEAQFFAAMARKNHDPRASDMKTIVPIHNAVNERAWAELLKWETGRGGERCGGVKLVNFKGRPNDMSPKARWKSLLGYATPFDRHDWTIERCGTQMRYVIDFYTGKSTQKDGVSFYLDVRPALDSWEAVRMRAEMLWSKLFR